MKIAVILTLMLLLLTGCNNSPVPNYDSKRLSYNPNFSNESNLEESSKELSMYKTTIYTKTDERQNNVKLACKQLNGVLIGSGETFSFCDTLGPATPEDGYQKADTFDTEGEIYQEYGGGKCQVSSTLYNAVKDIPGIEIIERHEHSNEVPYVPDGLDAAVAYGSVDLKFKNNNSYSIKILAKATDDEVIIRIIKI